MISVHFRHIRFFFELPLAWHTLSFPHEIVLLKNIYHTTLSFRGRDSRFEHWWSASFHSAFPASTLAVLFFFCLGASPPWLYRWFTRFVLVGIRWSRSPFFPLSLVGGFDPSCRSSVHPLPRRGFLRSTICHLRPTPSLFPSVPSDPHPGFSCSGPLSRAIRRSVHGLPLFTPLVPHTFPLRIITCPPSTGLVNVVRLTSLTLLASPSWRFSLLPLLLSNLFCLHSFPLAPHGCSSGARMQIIAY